MTLKEKIQSLIAAGNAATGNDDANLTDVMQTLINGFVDLKTPAFIADFSGEHPLSSQFYTWEGRDYDGVMQPLSSIRCSDGVCDLTTFFDSVSGKWLRQMMTTGGLFESDNFTLTFGAKFDGKAGSWNNIITYGTGTHWTNGTYSDGVKWPAGGEIDAFEQAGGFSANPNTFSPIFHYGAGSNSYYPRKHEYSNIASGISLPVNQWAEYKFDLKNGEVKIYVNGVLVANKNGSNLVVNNEYMWDYHPFLKPQAFYIDCQAAVGSASIDTSNEYHFYVKDFEITTASKTNTPCTGLSIFPQMWESGTYLVFPTNAEIFFDKVFTPANTSNKACNWQSSNPNVATVCQGYVKTLSEGTCVITATCGSAVATYQLTVSNANTSIPCAGVIVGANAIQIVGTNITDLSDVIYKYPRFTTDSVVLSSSDPTVATVDGMSVTGVGEGTATITVRCGNATTTVPVNVSSGIVFESDITLTEINQTLSEEAIVYDEAQTYSFQYTFGAHTPLYSKTTNNCRVGPVRSNDAVRNGAIQWLGASSKWVAIMAAEEKDISPAIGDVITVVYNFATNSMSIYKNGASLYRGDPGRDYFIDTAKIIAQRDNANMTIAPTHIKIAIGDLH